MIGNFYLIMLFKIAEAQWNVTISLHCNCEIVVLDMATEPIGVLHTPYRAFAFATIDAIYIISSRRPIGSAVATKLRPSFFFLETGCGHKFACF